MPHYKETFIDDGEVDVLRVLRILHQHGYEGVVIPDHAPAMSCPAPWHAGMAFALGYLKAGIAVAKGNKELLTQLNKGLAEIKANGTYQQIFDKYFVQ